MKILAIIFLRLITNSMGNSFNTPYYYEMSFEERIAGGKVMETNNLTEFKYQVGMRSYNLDTSITICGGALVHPKIVLTAAHCVVNTVYLGLFMGTIIKPRTMDSNENIKILPNNIIYHSDFNPTTYENDIAIIILPVEVKLSKYIGVIRLATKSCNCDVGKGWVSGWGRTTNVAYNPFFLNYVQVTAIKYDECHTTYTSLVPDKQLCSSGDKSRGICQGDSGGPYAFDDDDDGERYLCGLNSFIGSDDCINNWPKAYTSVAYYHEDKWICNNSNELVGCDYS